MVIHWTPPIHWKMPVQTFPEYCDTVKRVKFTAGREQIHFPLEEKMTKCGAKNDEDDSLSLLQRGLKQQRTSTNYGANPEIWRYFGESQKFSDFAIFY